MWKERDPCRGGCAQLRAQRTAEENGDGAQPRWARLSRPLHTNRSPRTRQRCSCPFHQAALRPKAWRSPAVVRRGSCDRNVTYCAFSRPLRELRLNSEPATPSLSPLALTSPRIMKKPYRSAATSLGTRALTVMATEQKQQQQQQQQQQQKLMLLTAGPGPRVPVRLLPSKLSTIPSRRVPIAAAQRSQPHGRPSRIPQARLRPAVCVGAATRT